MLFDTTSESLRVTQKAAQLLQTGNTLFATMLMQWQVGVSAVWDDANPQGVLAALGTQAVAVFTRAEQLRLFLESQMSGCTVEAAAKIKPVTFHEDGTVTINP